MTEDASGLILAWMVYGMGMKEKKHLVEWEGAESELCQWTNVVGMYIVIIIVIIIAMSLV